MPAQAFQFNWGTKFDWGLGTSNNNPLSPSDPFAFGSIDWGHLPLIGARSGKRFDFALNDLSHGPKLGNNAAAFSTTIDLFVNRDFMSPTQSGVSASYGIGSYWMWQPLISPGVQAFGDLAQISEGLPHYGEPQHRVGPALGGSLDLGLGPINWNLAYLFGLNNNTESGTLKAGFDYELPF